MTERERQELLQIAKDCNSTGCQWAGDEIRALLAQGERPSEGEEKPASGLATFAEARAKWEEENPHAEPSTTEGEPPTIAPGKKWDPAALEEWTPEQWARALDAARSDLMCAEDFEPSDVAHVMDICAQVLRQAREQGEQIEGWAVNTRMALWEFAANDENFTPGPASKPATLIIHPEPAGGEDE